jgi:hypothetical protein
VSTKNPYAGVATAAALEQELSKKKTKNAEWQSNPFLRLASINQACVNDKIQYDIGPAYKSAFPGYVDYFGLYNYFSNEGDFNFANNFWVPKNGLYDKYNNFYSILGADGSVVDPIHIGPKGYELWGGLIGTKLKQLGWNRTDDYIDPIVELDNDGPGKLIKKKSKAVGLFGKESGATERIKSRKEDPQNGYRDLGGYKRRYQNGSVIYLRQLSDVPLPDSGNKFDKAYAIGGLLHQRYLNEGGPSGLLGFPLSDPYSVHFGSIDKIDFECGYIDHNKMNILNPINTTVHYISQNCNP